ncbi:MAG: hypothetical protein AVDCRST_MAG33-2216 [uncultured Thermomicrobiales bacterium]|uniref:Uncharacterized protein n=1 Tax=uncultured Thermomicrobiales bacterium TaxID=1645740 RepID=A0A6J4V2N8_9BACT|nr:MAG: hypothetical protein AVDCRST_MAG33-2216 [uncultured Thermomicrobiales bacterium]
MSQITRRTRLLVALGLTLVVIGFSPRGVVAGSAQTVFDWARATVARDAITVQVSVVVDEERAGSASFSGMGSTADGIAVGVGDSTMVGRPAGTGEQTVVVIDQSGTEIDRERTDRHGRVVLDGLIGVPFRVAIGGVNTFSEEMVLSGSPPLGLSVVTYVSEGDRAASPAASSASPAVLAMTDRGESAAAPTSGPSLPRGLWPVLLLLGGTTILVSLATSSATRLQTSRR